MTPLDSRRTQLSRLPLFGGDLRQRVDHLENQVIPTMQQDVQSIRVRIGALSESLKQIKTILLIGLASGNPISHRAIDAIFGPGLPPQPEISTLSDTVDSHHIGA